jgi:hypothetical protein
MVVADPNVEHWSYAPYFINLRVIACDRTNNEAEEREDAA